MEMALSSTHKLRLIGVCEGDFCSCALGPVTMLFDGPFLFKLAEHRL